MSSPALSSASIRALYLVDEGCLVGGRSFGALKRRGLVAGTARNPRITSKGLEVLQDLRDEEIEEGGTEGDWQNAKKVSQLLLHPGVESAEIEGSDGRIWVNLTGDWIDDAGASSFGASSVQEAIELLEGFDLATPEFQMSWKNALRPIELTGHPGVDRIEVPIVGMGVTVHLSEGWFLGEASSFPADSIREAVGLLDGHVTKAL